MSVAAVAVGAIGAGATIAASNKAASAQKSAANQANQTLQNQYNQTREDNLSSMLRGTQAGNRLSQLLGLQLGPNGYSMTEDNFDAAAYLAANPDVAQAMGTKKGPPSAWWHYQNYGQGEGRGFTANEAAMQQAQTHASDPSFGSFNRNFTEQDFWADPVTKLGYDFGLQEGTNGLNRQAAAAGSLNSGATLKALTRFANDYASTKGNESFNRFNTNKMNTYNMLAGLSGAGQAATQHVNSVGANTAGQIGQNQIGIGNARAASAIGGANAITGAIGQGWNMHMGNQLLSKLGNGGGMPASSANYLNSPGLSYSTGKGEYWNS